MYLLMGWIIVLVIQPLIANLPPAGLFWLAAGGGAYTLGAIIYSIKGIPFNHGIFHIFVLTGAACHFLAVYLYV
jgi:hemolysin III